MTIVTNNNKRVSETGSALVYILIAIALLAALTASFMRPSSQQTTAQGSFNAATEIKSQLEFIRSSIQECVLVYQEGDKGDPLDLVTSPGLDGTPNTPYPISPTNTYFVTPAASDDASFIRCPGNPGNSRDHAAIFGGSSGKFLPPAPNLFEEWQYHNGVDGVFLHIETNKTDAFLQTALAKLDENYSECQADVIDASAGDIDLTSTAGASDPICTSGSTCFRLWIIIQPTAVYNGDTDTEELGAGC